MTKKDYELIARAIKGGTIYHDLHYINKLSFVDDICNKLEQDNPRFDRNKFLTACGVIDPISGLAFGLQ